MINPYSYLCKNNKFLLTNCHFLIHKLIEKSPAVSSFMCSHWQKYIRIQKVNIDCLLSNYFWNMFLLIELYCDVTSYIRWCIWQDSGQALVMGFFYSGMFISVDLWNVQPWLVWLSGLSTSLRTERLRGSIPSQGICLSCGPGLQVGALERQPLDVSLTHQCFSPSLILSFKINK